ncbi:MAG: TonB-dependent receptor [Alistipes sp.]|nr:TonB-dependent receptor [Alistipes sp.]
MRNLNNFFRSVLWLTFLLASGTLYAQQQSITGTVIDGSTRTPLPGATVFVEGSTRGVVTNVDGTFVILAEPTDVINISFMGYEAVSVSGEQLSRYPTIVLQEDAEMLEEVIVVGYGTQTKASSVAAITQTGGEDLMRGGNVTTVSEALQGKLNGVVAINSTGRPGESSAELFIRGKSSWNGTNPLVLVDGVERDFNDIDMNEIETLSVLKDASATAVYGVRGANGVILLTTKRGSTDRPKINFNSSWGFKQPTRNLEFADYPTTLRIWNEAMANDNLWDQIIPESTIAAWDNAWATGNYGPYNDVFPNVDWYDHIMKDSGFTQKYNVNVSGGSEFINYFLSLGYQHDGDVYNTRKQNEFDPRYYFNRYNWRTNFDFQVTKTTKFTVNISGNLGYRNGGYYNQDPFTKALQTPSNEFPIKYSDGEWGETQQGWMNVLAEMNTRGQQTFKTLRSFYDAKLEQDLSFITPGLRASAQLSYNTRSTTRTNLVVGNVLGNGDGNNVRDLIQVRYYREYDFANPIVDEDGNITYPLLKNVKRFDENSQEGPWPVNGNYDVMTAYSRKLYYEFAVNYSRKFGDHAVSGLALVNRQIDESRNSSGGMDFPGYREDWVGRFTYNWKQRYMFEMNMSYTGSEVFAPSKRFGFFPSLSAGWRVTEEPFMQKAKKTVTNLKLRYSWGQVGSDARSGDAPKYNYLSFFETTNVAHYGRYSQINTADLFLEANAGYPYTTWETGTKQNLGIELSLWNKLDMALELYDEKRSGIMNKARSIMSWFGTDFPFMNLGKTKSHGFELEIGWADKVGNFHYFLNFSMQANENRVVFRDDPESDPEHIKERGKPIGWQSRYIAWGNFETLDDIFNFSQSAIDASPNIPGDLVYIDFNGDGIIDSNDQVVTSKLNYPQQTYSFNFGGNWKGIGFSALLYAPTKVYKNILDQLYLDFPDNNKKAQPWAMDRWTKETANTEGVIRPSVHAQANRTHNNQASTYKYRNFSYLRLKNVELNYSFPKKITGRLGMTNMSVYVNANNLITWSNVDKRVDPETGGADQYPIVKSYTVGLRLGF